MPKPFCQILAGFTIFQVSSSMIQSKTNGFGWKYRANCQTNELNICLGCQVMKSAGILRSLRMLTLQSSCHTMHFAKPIELDLTISIILGLQHPSSRKKVEKHAHNPGATLKGLDIQNECQNACKSLGQHLTCLEMSGV